MSRTFRKSGKHLCISSPFRYPGAKSKIIDAIFDCYAGDTECATYVEPFAGGGSSMCAFVNRFGLPKKIVLNDKDPAVASFWRCIADAELTQGLLDRIRRAVLTVGEHTRQTALLDSNDDVEAGFAALFVNRTSYSGLIGKGGPIGGKGQNSSYPIGCRFNSKLLVRKILELHVRVGPVLVVESQDFRHVIASHDKNNTVLYSDAPYYEKGWKMYRHCFSEQDHRDLATALQGLKKACFLASYDDHPFITALYEGWCSTRDIDVIYSSAKESDTRNRTVERVFYSGSMDAATALPVIVEGEVESLSVSSTDKKVSVTCEVPAGREFCIRVEKPKK